MNSAEPIEVDDPEVDGHLAGRITYRGELFTGQTVGHDPDGRRIALTTYADGIQDGPSKEWYPDGHLRQLHFFDEIGNHLSRTIWDEDGNAVNGPAGS